MSRIGWVAAATVVIMVSAQSAAAQSDFVPAEFPPSSFTGNQFVDSNGCAFIRAGVGGTTSWVPRVARSRTPLCNFQPTFPAGVAGPAPRPAFVAPLDAPIIEIRPPASAAPAPAPVEIAGAPAPRAASTRSVGAPIQTVASIPAAPVVSPRVTAPAAAPVQRQTSFAEACDGKFGVQPGFLSLRTGQPIDCGPAPAAVAVAAAPIAITAPVINEPVAPAPVRMTLAEVCAASAQNPNTRYVRIDGSPIICDVPAPITVATPIAVPQIAAPVVTAAAAPASASVCPNIPNMRSLNGEPVRCGPQAAKPYTVVSQGGGAAVVSTKSQGGLFEQPVPASNPVVASRAAPRVPQGYAPVWTDGRINPQRGQVAQSAARVSTRTAVPAAVQAPAAAAMTHRYVQVGTFGDPANAERMIARLGGMGYPVASAKSGGLKVIAAGPFNSPAALASALQAVRGLGFADAYTRN